MRESGPKFTAMVLRESRQIPPRYLSATSVMENGNYPSAPQIDADIQQELPLRLFKNSVDLVCIGQLGVRRIPWPSPRLRRREYDEDKPTVVNPESR